MKRLSKAILLGLGVLLVLLLAGALGLNAYIQSPTTQERIQTQLSKALGMPLKLTKTSFSLWKGLGLSGITIPQQGANFFEAGSFTAGYRMLPLLAGRLSVPEMSVDAPKLVWKQNAEGKWKLPELEKAAAAPGEKPDAKTANEGKQEGGLVFDIGRLVVTGGAVELLDKEGKHTATCTGLDANCTTLTKAKVEGTIQVARLVWADSLVLENVRTPFQWAGGELTLPDLTATLAGGPVRGSFRAHPAAPGAPYEAAFKFERVNLDRLATEAGWKPGQAGGTAAGQLALAGDLNRFERSKGPGQFQIRDGQFKQLALFQSIGQALGIRELSDLRLKDGHGDFHIENERLIVDQMVLTALNLQLTGKGTVRFNKKVEMETQLGLDEGLVKQLPDVILGSLAKADNGGRTIDFKITGTTDKLRTDLLDRLLGAKINRQFDDLLSGIFGGRNKDDEKKKKEEEEQRKEEKKRKKEQEKAAKAAAAAAAPPAPATPEPATTLIAPVKP